MPGVEEPQGENERVSFHHGRSRAGHKELREQMSTFVTATHEGARAAQREHRRIKTALDRPVEVFDVIAQAGIWLMFQPLQKLFGAYQRSGTAAGILINANHPLSLQRYTAAHEYGHHVLGHEMHCDVREDIEDSGQSLKEVAAQSFAADFLMPLPLVNLTLRRLGFPIKTPGLTARDVYRIALELGASYAATVTQLVSLKKLAPARARHLRKQRPVEIKRELLGGTLEETRADVWLVEDSEQGRLLSPRVGDRVYVVLKECPSTGYTWTVGTEGDQANAEGLSVSRELYESDESPREYGGWGRHHFVFRVDAPGSRRLRLRLSRPWELASIPEETFEVALSARGRTTGESERGLLEGQKALLAIA